MDSFPISAELLKLRGEAQAMFHARAAAVGASVEHRLGFAAQLQQLGAYRE